jgi:hypothetical protein
MDDEITYVQALSGLLTNAIAITEHCKKNNIALKNLKLDLDYLDEMNYAIEQAKSFLDAQYQQQKGKRWEAENEG